MKLSMRRAVDEYHCLLKGLHLLRARHSFAELVVVREDHES
jgi:hypothetical protein